MAKYLNESGLSKVFQLIKTNYATKSEIPTNLNELTNGPGYITGVDWDDITGKPESFASESHTHTTADINKLTGYAIASTAGAIAATDTLNQALGKLQKTKLDATATAADSSKLGGTAASSYATKSYVDTSVANLVNSAPETLDTLSELSAALGDNPNFATDVATQIGGKVGKTDPYLKNASVSENTLTITKGDDTTVTFNNTVYEHPNSGITANSYGPTANVTGTNNTTIKVPQITVDAQGHVTDITERTYTSKDTTYTAGTAAMLTAASPSSTQCTWTPKILTDYIQAIDTGVMSVATGSANGTISVDGSDVAVKGLGSAAYTASTAYAPASHNHPSSDINLMTGYSKPNATSAIAATDTLNAAIGKLEKALDGKAASSHNQASNTINAMTGYSKPSSTSAIGTSDTLNAAIGKLEKALDSKLNSADELTETEIVTIWNNAS